MWKCQNLLRHQVKDLVDLIKQPKVSEYAIILKNKTKQKRKKPTKKNSVTSITFVWSLILLTENNSILLDNTFSKKSVYVLSVRVGVFKILFKCLLAA